MNPEQQAVQDSIDLKDPALAAFLAWLIPGLGHLYQRRIGKAVLFFVCIFGTFAYGCYLGGSRELGWGRVVYFSWAPGARRWAYICQAGIGLPALPALLNRGEKPWFHGFMAPPGTGGDPALPPPSESDLHRKLHHYFEFGTVYTMIAGLLNVLAIYDAWGGPVFSEPAKKDDEEDEEEKDASEEDARNDAAGDPVPEAPA